MTPNLRVPLKTLLISLPCLAIGLSFLVFSLIPSVYEWNAMRHWNPVPATVTHAELKVSHSDDSTTFLATATYTYSVNGRNYTHSRVGINDSYDNLGSWQEDKGAILQEHRDNSDLIIVYVNPNNPQDSVIYPELRLSVFAFKLAFAVIFTGIGIGFIVSAIRKNTWRTSNPYAPDAPWRANKGWQNPITSNAKSSLIGTWVFALIGCAVSFALAINTVPPALAQGNYGTLFVLIFVLIGLLSLYWAIKKTMLWRHFGPTPLWLEPYPGAIGGHIGGTIKCDRPLNASTAHITLECILHYQSGSGRDRQSKQSIVWQTQGSAPVVAQNTTGHPQSYIAFYFNVPNQLPASEPRSQHYHCWKITLKLSDNKATLSRQFTIPAFHGTERSQLNITNTADNAQTRDTQEQTLESLLNIQQISGGIALAHKAGRDLKTNALLLIIGLVFWGVGIGIGFTDDTPIFMVMILSLLGGALSLCGFYKLLNSYHVKIGHAGLYTERYILGIKTRQRFYASHTIKHLAIKSTGHSTIGNHHTEHFVITAVLNNGKTVNVAESLNGQSIAEYALENISLLSGYPKL
ncbi:DUF3592 domain-containing protein [Marinagarivorans algicola]|uniref:DUF3592 domain-containing protein n=1 Tax=Marinagarivorans algicola TaxID=1513270 RepID=UPI0009E972A0|nr:DUF3592 domain-containing protein [Marinagarivorans algicola]